MEETSAELLERYRRGDERASEALFARYVERLTAAVRWQIAPKLRRRIDAEDAVQSAYRSFFLKARRGEFVLEQAGDLWKLLVTIALNKLRRQIAHHRAGKRSVDRESPLDSGAIGFAEGPSPLEVLAATDELQSLMAKLTPDQRTVLELRLQDRTWGEIAAETGRSERTVRRVIEGIRLILMGAHVTGPLNLAKHFEAPNPSTAVATDTLPEATQELDYRDFVLEEFLGSGGMGKVYRARQKGHDRRIAVKMLRKSRWTLPGASERFLEEARTVAGLNHPGIVGLRGVGKLPGGVPFIAMDFIEGSNLAAIVAESLPSHQQAIAWIAEAADAIDHAHSRGIIHCDLKPSNLLRRSDGRIFVTDFGLATSLRDGKNSRPWAGTWGYMAPEQLDAAFGEIGPATDVFALGLVLVQLLTGRVDFHGPRLLEVLATRDLPRNWMFASADRRMPDDLRELIAECLVIDPAKRLANCRKFAELLRQIAGGVVIP